MSAQIDGFKIEPIVVSAAAGTFESEASAMAKAALGIRQRLAELGSCWGDDTVGARFGRQYETPALTVLDNVESLAVGLLRISAALEAVSNAYVRGEEDLIAPIPDPALSFAAPPTVAAVQQPLPDVRPVAVTTGGRR